MTRLSGQFMFRCCSLTYHATYVLASRVWHATSLCQSESRLAFFAVLSLLCAYDRSLSQPPLHLLHWKQSYGVAATITAYVYTLDRAFYSCAEPWRAPTAYLEASSDLLILPPVHTQGPHWCCCARSAIAVLLLCIIDAIIILIEFSTIVERKRGTHHHESTLSRILEVPFLKHTMPRELSASLCYSCIPLIAERAST